MSKRLSGPLSPKEIEDRFEGAFRARAPWHPCLTTSAPRLFQCLACHCANEVGDHGHGAPAHEDLGDTAIHRPHGRMLRLGCWLKPGKPRVVWFRAEGMRLPADLPQAGREQGNGLGSGWATALIKISHRLKADDKARMSKPKKQAS